MTFDRAVAALGLGRAAALGAGIVAGAVGRSEPPSVVEIRIHFSTYEPAAISVPAGRPITFVITNSDPIDHEWIVGDADVHDRHRTGTEPAHDARPTEISVPALTERRTTVTFDRPGKLAFICHLPGHEAYGMVGTLMVSSD
jgi:uncharacterized cupredoxin-like copper-binding protein